MGGVAGHLAHLYDDRSLSFNKIKSILVAASTGKLEGTEKTDGFNIYLGIKEETGAWAPAWARNKTDMSINGRTFAELAAREFQGGEKIKKTYLDAFNAFQAAVNSLNDNEKARIFGKSGEIFWNTEIQGPGASNVVNYDKNILSIHRSGHKKYIQETNKVESVLGDEMAAASKFLDSIIDRFEEATASEPFSVRRTAALELNQLSNNHDLNIALEEMKKAGFSGAMTISQFLEIYVTSETERKMNFLSPEIQQEIIKRILKTDDSKTLTQIYKGFPGDVKLRIKEFVDTGPLILKDAIWPIELSIHNFAVELLKGLRSAYILDENQPVEVQRLKSEVEEAIRTIHTYQGQNKEEVHQILRDQLLKLKHHDNITTVVEGFVFQIGDQMYKFTGNFAPMNQLLGLFRYGRGNVPPLKKMSDDKLGEQPMDNLTEPETREEAQVIALIPGAYKPPHRGHLDMVKHYSSLSDKVVVLISPLSRKSTSGETEIKAEQSRELWNLYLSSANLGNVEVQIAEYNSPIEAAFEWVKNPKNHGNEIILGASTKGGDAAKRFGGDLQQYAPNVKILDPLKYAFKPVGEELSASDFREALDDPNFLHKGVIYEFIPEEAHIKIGDIINILGKKEKRTSSGLMEEKEAALPLGIFLGLIEETINETYEDLTSMYGYQHNIRPEVSHKFVSDEEDENMCGDTSIRIAVYQTKPGEEIEEASALVGGNIEGGATKGVFKGLDVDKENKKEKKRSKEKRTEKELEEFVSEVCDYLL